MKQHLATIVQVIGTSMVAMSLAIVHPALGLGFAGAAVVAFGIAAERSS
jgi:small basic protein